LSPTNATILSFDLTTTTNETKPAGTAALNIFVFTDAAPAAMYVVPVFAFARGVVVAMRALAFPALYDAATANAEAWRCVALAAANALLLLLVALAAAIGADGWLGLLRRVVRWRSSSSSSSSSSTVAATTRRREVAAVDARRHDEGPPPPSSPSRDANRRRDATDNFDDDARHTAIDIGDDNDNAANAARSTPAPLELRGLTKSFGKRVAVDHLSFRVRPGECFGLLAMNGGGKSTTINMCSGVLTPGIVFVV
jgi:ABC-type multidrug transport system fused ATPase/permease subunit